VNPQQKINYIQAGIDHDDLASRAFDSSRESILKDFEVHGFHGSRFIASDRTEVKEIIDESEDKQLPELLALMFRSKNDPHKFRDSSFAVVDFLTEIINQKAIELAEEQQNEKEI
tara:strand:+ start:33305 stop:33649 length:345 start_codon:yes stop_codon:yes gene_type:complete